MSKFQLPKYSLLLALYCIACFTLHAIRPNVINFGPKVYNGSNKNWSVASDENGIIYVGNDKGLIEFDGISWLLNRVPSKGVVRSVGIANNRVIYTGGTEEFGKWERDISGKLKYTSLSAKVNFKEVQNSDFWKIFVTKKGVYFQSFSAIFLYDYKTVRKLKSVVSPILLLNQVRGILLYQKMKGEIYILDGDHIQKFPGSERFSSTDVRLILPYGKTGYLFATNSKGIVVYENGQYRDLNAKTSSLLNTKEVNTGVLTKWGTYLFGTLLDGMYEVDIDGNIVNHFASGKILQNKSVLCLWQDRKGNVWLGLDKGLSCISYKRDLNYFINTIDNIGSIYAACFWKDRLMIGTNQGVFSIPKSELQGYSAESNLHFVSGSEGQVWSLKVIDGVLYCCHNNGLFTISDDLKMKKSYDFGTGVYNIYSQQFENSTYLAAATYQSLKFVNPKLGKIISPKGVDEVIYSMTSDHLGNLWLEHPNRGVYRCRWYPENGSFQSVHYYGGNASRYLPNKLQLFKVGGRVNMIGDDKVFQYNDIADRVEPNQVLNKLFSNLDPIRKIFYCSQDKYIALGEYAFHLFSYDGYKASLLQSYSIGHNLSLVDNFETIISLNDSVSLLALDDGFILYQIPKNPEASSKIHVEAPVINAFKTTNKEKEIEFRNVEAKSIDIRNTFNTVEIYFTTKNAYSDYVSSQYMLEGVDMGWSSRANTNKVSYERLPAGNYTFRVRAVDIGGNFSKETILHFNVQPPWYSSVWAYFVYVVLIGGALYAGRMIVLYRFKRKHLRKMRKLETMRLQVLADELQNQINQKNAELVTQTSFIIHKNELIEKIRALIDEFYMKNKSTVLQQLIYKINSLLNHNLDTEEDWKNFLIKFEEKHTDFFKRLKTEYPTLTSSDLRLCACLKLNMETKDIASLMNLSVRAVENNRYRLRKKLDLRTEQNLNEFFIAID